MHKLNFKTYSYEKCIIYFDFSSLSLSLSLSSFVQAQNVNIDNRTACDYILNLGSCDEDDCSNGPLDAPDNQVSQYNLSTVGMSSPTDVGTICICENPGPDCELIKIDPCTGGITPIHTCTVIDCNGNTLYVDWWISTGGTDFEILLRI